MAKRWTLDGIDRYRQTFETATIVWPVVFNLGDYLFSLGEHGDFETGPEEGCFALKTQFW